MLGLGLLDKSQLVNQIFLKVCDLGVLLKYEVFHAFHFIVDY